jgi:2-polyprenyl-6-methoxyphenol hydroxylase-like FAD-dependent oxidoreductase
VLNFRWKTVQSINLSDDKATIKFSEGSKVESKIVVGADGVWSTVAKQFQLRNYKPCVGLSLFQEIPISSATLDKYFTKKCTKYVDIYFENGKIWSWTR